MNKKHSKTTRLCEKASKIKQMSRAKNIRIKVWKHRAVECLEIEIVMVRTYGIHLFALS